MQAEQGEGQVWGTAQHTDSILHRMHLSGQLVLHACQAQLQLLGAVRVCWRCRGVPRRGALRPPRLHHGGQVLDARPVLCLLQAQALVLGLQGEQALPLLKDEGLGACQGLRPYEALLCTCRIAQALQLGWSILSSFPCRRRSLLSACSTIRCSCSSSTKAMSMPHIIHV